MYQEMPNSLRKVCEKFATDFRYFYNYYFQTAYLLYLGL